MLSAQTLVNLQVGIYAYPGEPPVVWEAQEETSGVYWGLSRQPEADVVVLRGSATFQDWYRDFDDYALAQAHANFGHVHPGFYLGTEAAWGAIAPHLRPAAPLVLVGHSLGAGHANMLCNWALLAGRQPSARVVFGEPKSGLLDFASRLGVVPSWSFCNRGDDGHDLVTEVPFSLLDENYARAGELTYLKASAPLLDPWFLFRYHHAKLYQKALLAEPEFIILP